MDGEGHQGLCTPGRGSFNFLLQELVGFCKVAPLRPEGDSRDAIKDEREEGPGPSGPSNTTQAVVVGRERKGEIQGQDFLPWEALPEVLKGQAG